MDELQPRKLMKRREIPLGLRFVTFSCAARLPILTADVLCETVMDGLTRCRVKYGTRWYAYVIMPDHLHLLCGAGPEVPLHVALKSLKVSVARRAAKELRTKRAAGAVTGSGGVLKIWERGGGFDRNVRDLAEFSRAARYVHLNPVEAALVAHPQDWRWSSVRWWMGKRDGEFACDDPPGDAASWRLWTGYM